ncbi:MAG TPA: insulinase family protein, partial [Candidatus Polarisedimenticolia bacterium]|nr:insulinase family protein [Candidatus Polarisedimenticolia bacterium]
MIGRVAAVACIVAATAAATPPEGPRVNPKNPAGRGGAATDDLMVLLPVPDSPLVSFRFQFRTGAADDPVELQGVTAATALTVAEGGTADLTRRQVIDRLYPMAASIGVLVDHEVTTFTGQVHRDQAMEFYQLIASILKAPRFDEADFRRSRDQLVASIASDLRGHDDEELAKETLNASIFFGHPYGHPVAGTVQWLKSLRLEQVKGHWARQFQRS